MLSGHIFQPTDHYYVPIFFHLAVLPKKSFAKFISVCGETFYSGTAKVFQEEWHFPDMNLFQ